jgi:uncharacterized protein
LSDDAQAQELTLRWNEPLAVEITAAVQRGQGDRVTRLVNERPGLARAWIVKDGEAAGWRSLLHLFADWPGHRRNPRGIVAALSEAGADLNASHDGGEAPLHWAASNDDVELVDALLDAGADVDVPGSIIGGLGPIADAAAFGGYRAGQRLVDRGARTNIYQAASFGLIDRVRDDLLGDPAPDAEQITTSFWAACRYGHDGIAAMLLEAGADINWVGWTNETPLDLARQVGAGDHLVEWLLARGARGAAEIR